MPKATSKALPVTFPSDTQGTCCEREREKMDGALASCQYRHVNAVWLTVETEVKVDITHLSAQSTGSEDSHGLP